MSGPEVGKKLVASSMEFQVHKVNTPNSGYHVLCSVPPGTKIGDVHVTCGNACIIIEHGKNKKQEVRAQKATNCMTFRVFLPYTTTNSNQLVTWYKTCFPFRNAQSYIIVFICIWFLCNTHMSCVLHHALYTSWRNVISCLWGSICIMFWLHCEYQIMTHDWGTLSMNNALRKL